MKNQEGKIWFSAISVNNNDRLTTLGTSPTFIDGEELLSPLYEYNLQIPWNYAGPVVEANHDYRSLNYIREIPEIKKWYQIHGETIPAAHILPSKIVQ
jgi:hypothetical protein